MRRASQWLLIILILACAHVAEAQQTKKIPRIGYLSQLSPSNDTRREGFRQGLRELGYIEGQNIVMDWRFTEGKN